MEIYSPAISSAAAEYISTLNSKVTGGDGRLRQGLAAAADESRRAGSGHRRHREGPRTFRSGSNGRRRATASFSSATSIEGMRAQPGDVLFRIADHSVVWAIDRCRRARSGQRSPSGQRAVGARAQLSRAGVFREGRRDLSADQQGDANGARARRIAQSGTAADPRHVCRCRDRHRQRASPCSRFPKAR